MMLVDDVGFNLNLLEFRSNIVQHCCNIVVKHTILGKNCHLAIYVALDEVYHNQLNYSLLLLHPCWLTRKDDQMVNNRPKRSLNKCVRSFGVNIWN